MRIQFHHNNEWRYSKFFINGAETGIYRHDDSLENIVSKVIESTYSRAKKDTILEMQKQFKTILGIE